MTHSFVKKAICKLLPGNKARVIIRRCAGASYEKKTDSNKVGESRHGKIKQRSSV